MTSKSRLSWEEEEKLYLLIEECGEVIQSASKILRHGYHSENPATGERNRAALEREIADVLLAVNILQASGDVDQDTVQGHYELAIQRKHRYIHDFEIPSSLYDAIP